MKKLGIYFMMLAMMAVTFAGCKEDDDGIEIAKPVITINEGTDISLIDVNAEFKIPVVVTSADENINWIIVTITDVNKTSYDVAEYKDIKDKKWEHDFVLTEVSTILLELNQKGIAPEFFNVQVSTPTHLSTIVSQGFILPDIQEPLSDPVDFTWRRVGTANGTGLAEFGLQWTSNTGSNIVITPLSGAKLVELTVTDWTTLITTKEDLANAVENGTGLAEWKVIPAKTTFNYVIATKTAEGKYFLINPTERTINPSDPGDRTVTGKYKY